MSQPGAEEASPTWAPAGVPRDKPSAARMYEYLLGGYHNFAIDRQAADAATAIYPDFPLVMQANRAFLRRAVRFLASAGISRYLDIGSGIPTVDNTHQVASKAHPHARVVYVDNDPIAVAHSAAILAQHDRASIIQADAVETQSLLAHPMVRELVGSGEPVGLLLVAMLHFVPDDDRARGVVRELMGALPSGSYLVISHATHEDLPKDVRDQLVRLYSRTTTPVRTRSRAEITRFFDDLELVEPGVTAVPSWRPESPDDLLVQAPGRAGQFAGVGRKP